MRRAHTHSIWCPPPRTMPRQIWLLCSVGKHRAGARRSYHLPAEEALCGARQVCNNCLTLDASGRSTLAGTRDVAIVLPAEEPLCGAAEPPCSCCRHPKSGSCYRLVFERGIELEHNTGRTTLLACQFTRSSDPDQAQAPRVCGATRGISPKI